MDILVNLAKGDARIVESLLKIVSIVKLDMSLMAGNVLDGSSSALMLSYLQIFQLSTKTIKGS